MRGVNALEAEDLTLIDRAGSRCAVCRTGRRRREFGVVQAEGGQPLVMCPACRARYGDAPPAPAEVARPEADRHGAEPTPAKPEPRRQEREDRVRRVLRELPEGEYSTGRIAKAAALNHAKTLRRLSELAASGEIRQVGKRWSTERSPSDIDLALERLQARTSNIRIVRDKTPVS